MNVASATNRRRHSLPIPQRRKRPRSSQSRPTNPLSGVVVCLSGQTSSDKTRLESLISTLGGVAIRDFDPAYVTHLVLDEAKGSKYEYVKRNKEREFAKRLKVVKSEWVIDCDREGKRVDESFYSVDETVEQEMPSGNDALPTEIQNAPLEEACDWMLENSFPRIFVALSFLLVGFDLSEKSLDSNSDENKNMQVMIKLSKLIRRAGGTIYWTPNDEISVVVLSDDCSADQWDDVREFCQHHPRGPMAVTAEWIFSSLHNQTIKAPAFPPMPKAAQKYEEIKSYNDTNSRLPGAATVKTAVLNSNVFYGDIFAIVRPKPHDGTMSFEKAEMESLITSNGGLLLTKQLFDAIKTDIQSAYKNNTSISRNFYVVSSGGYGDHTKLNPLLADLSKLGVKFVSVTPIWVNGCIGDEVKYNAEEYSLLFQPQPWPIRLLPPNNFLISLTGFVDASRYGIIWMLKAIGAEYTDNLKSKNTHLICKDASGKKYEKACEWGLHVISVEWLHHVVRFGYRNDCEMQFSLVKSEPISERKDAARKKSLYESNKVNSYSELSKRKVETETIDNFKDNKNDDTKPTKVPHSVDLRLNHKFSSFETVAAARTQLDDTVKELQSNNEIINDKGEKDTDSLPDATSSIRDAVKNIASSNATKQKEVDPQLKTEEDSVSPNNVNKRLHSALQSLETSSHTNKPAFQRRSQRQRQPIKYSDKSLPLLTQHSPQSEEDYPQTEQFTVAVRADTCLTSGSHDSVPQSQVDDAEDNGESQVVWFAEKRIH